jgi:hypoxanthine phosphoribosyltransferase
MPIRPVIDAEAIAGRVAELGKQITSDYDGKELVLVVVLKGSFVFAADLARHIDLDVGIDFLGVRSYGDAQESSGVVEITNDLSRSIEGQHVILVEDIVDTGLTVHYLRENLETRQPASLRIASLLHKPARTKVSVDIDYLGFTIDDVFIVGYGLDSGQKFRNLPFLGVVDPSGG